MELGKYQEIAREIVMNAVKELAIERGLKDLAEVWKTMEFTVVKHYKGTMLHSMQREKKNNVNQTVACSKNFVNFFQS